ncbi:hypothetical protein JCM21900_000432 [Sporobolomyces salmonicolor]
MAPRRNRRPQPAADSPGQVFGPRSALTSFLREQGITGPGASFSGRIRQPPQEHEQEQHGHDPGTATDREPSVEVTTTLAPPAEDHEPVPSASTSVVASTSSSPVTAGNAHASSSSGTKRKPPKQATAAVLKKQKQQQADEFMIAGKPEGPKKGRYENRTPGAIAVCAECGKKFTVSKYTASNPNGPGVLCSPCTSESIETRATFPGANKPKPKTPAKKKAQKALDESFYQPVTSLQQSCLSVIGQYINDVEALGDIGPKNLDRVAKIVCKNRGLTGNNLRLFLDIGHRELKLYDCTNLSDKELAQIATFCPHLERLSLNFCGRLDDDVIDAWSKGLKELRFLSLYAPYLVTAKKWEFFFETCGASRPSLDGFALRMSSRFNDASLASLVSNNPSLSYLQLSEIGRFTGESLKLLYPLKGLTSLDISRLGTPQGTVLEDDEVVELLKEVGGELVELVLDGNYNLTDRVLTDGVKRYCPHLRSLSLHDLSEMNSAGVEELFSSSPVVRPPPADDGEVPEGPPADDGDGATPSTFTRWPSPGLQHLNLHRLAHLTPSALSALIAHSGPSLRTLKLHSCDELTTEALSLIAHGCPDLEVLDLSFVRAVDNFVVQALLDGCPKLRFLFVHGNNRVTADVPRKRGVQIRGLENAVHSDMPAGVWEA